MRRESHLKVHLGSRSRSFHAGSVGWPGSWGAVPGAMLRHSEMRRAYLSSIFSLPNLFSSPAFQGHIQLHITLGARILGAPLQLSSTFCDRPGLCDHRFIPADG